MTEITLPDGRSLEIEPLAPHEAMKLAEGARALSGNRGWWKMALAMAAIRSINGVPNPFPTHKKHIEGLCGRFDGAAMAAIREAAEKWPVYPPCPPLELSPLTPLEKLRVYELAEDCNDVPGWIAAAFIAAGVRKIDGEDVAFPSSKAEMRELVQRLGIGGMVEASAFMEAQFVAERARFVTAASAAKN